MTLLLPISIPPCSGHCQPQRAGEVPAQVPEVLPPWVSGLVKPGRVALRHVRTCVLRSCLALLLAACDSPDESPVVEAEPPSFGAIEVEPVLVIESAAAPGDPRDSPIAGTYRLQDGATVVARERQIVWYDVSGNVIRSRRATPRQTTAPSRG